MVSGSEQNRTIRVVVGEDSPFMQRMIVDALNSDPAIKVVGAGSDGREVLKRVADLRPDCVTLDLEMPSMDGFETLRYIMSEWPTPVVIVSIHTAEGAMLTLKCLEYGAVDFISKTQDGRCFPARELIEKVKAAAAINPAKIKFSPPECFWTGEPSSAHPSKLEYVVLMGASTGGPQALMDIIPKLPPDLPAGIIIVQHMPPNFTRYFAERLDGRSGLIVKEADEGNLIIPGKALVAPGGMHLFLAEYGGKPAVMLLARNELQRSSCPCVDFAMTSFAPILQERLIGVVLTGMGSDGTAGSDAIRRFGGSIICQDEETSLVFGMPGAVIAQGLANEVLPLGAIADRVVEKIYEIKAGEPVCEYS